MRTCGERTRWRRGEHVHAGLGLAVATHEDIAHEDAGALRTSPRLEAEDEYPDGPTQ